MSRGKTSVKIDVDALDLLGSESQRGTPERNLLMAILERAILDFVGNNLKEVEKAENWLFDFLNGNSFEEDSKSAPFSFSWICQQLDLNRTFVAETIKAMPKRGQNRVAPWYFMKNTATT